MKKIHRLLLTAFLLSSIFLGANASATLSIIPDDLFIDFRDDPWPDAYDEHEWTVGNVTATALPWCRNLYQDDMDGLGILGGEPDEINYWEKLKVNLGLADNEGIYVDGVWITDLFKSPDGV